MRGSCSSEYDGLQPAVMRNVGRAHAPDSFRRKYKGGLKPALRPYDPPLPVRSRLRGFRVFSAEGAPDEEAGGGEDGEAEEGREGMGGEMGELPGEIVIVVAGVGEGDERG